MKAIFKQACPNCKGDIGDDRLLAGLPCHRCLDDKTASEILRRAERGEDLKRLVIKALEDSGRLKHYVEAATPHLKVEEFNEFFKRAVGYPLWSAQRTWAKRILTGRSFAVVAPTGVGKTLFGLAMSAYLASKGKRCYIVSPTTLLVEQARKRLEEIIKTSGLNIRLAYYSAALHKADKEEQVRRIKEKDFDVLITTSSFLARKFNLLKKCRFDFIFVDDVDAILKASKNIDRVLVLLGLSDEIVEKTLELIKLRREVARAARHREPNLEELRTKAEELSKEVEKAVKRRKLGLLVVSTATGRARGTRVKLFRELLGFEVGSRAEAIRNIQDLYAKPRGDLDDEVVDLVSKLGGGGLVFVPLDRGVEVAERVTQKLKERGVKAELVYAKGRKEEIAAFAEGEISVLVGMASYYGLLVRGLDLPETVRYAVFAGVPKMRFTLDLKEAYPSRILQLLVDVKDALSGDEQTKALRLIGRMRRLLWRLTPAAFEELRKALDSGVEPPSWLRQAYYTVKEAAEFVFQVLSREEVKAKLRESSYLSFTEEEGKVVVTVPDVPTYIQASGRTSRLYAGGVSKGVSVVFVDDERVFNGLVRQTRWLAEEVKWASIDEVDLGALMKEVDEDRERIRRLLRGEVRAEGFEPVKSVLLIVESPTKAKTIASFFGKPSRRRIGEITAYEVGTGKYILNVVATGGHVYDLVTKGGYYGVRIEDGRFIPVYATIKRCLACGDQFVDQGHCPLCGSKEFRDSLETIEALRDLASEFDLTYVGTDPDTEGEKISWDVTCSLKPYSNVLKRVEFHEVTRPALLRALEELRGINEGLVEANIVRRVEDRWIGFELSRRLWKVFGSRHLSAGRVQTPVLGWIIKRFEEFKNSRKLVYNVQLDIDYRVTLDDVPREIPQEEVVRKLSEATCKVVEFEEVEEEVSPPPPFTTDALLKEASARLRLGAAETMSIAQDLFELGLITYHRTDNTRVSATGRQIAREYIKEHLGEELYQGREWPGEGAHECIRPTRPIDVEQLRTLVETEALMLPKRPTRRHYALYDLIFRRFMASQMVKAKVKRARIKIDLAGFTKELEGVIDVVEPGFTLMYRPTWFFIPKELDGSKVVSVEAREVPTVLPYTQGEVIALMKEKGIGRPSTYAKIVDTLLKRKYVVESKTGRLIPTSRGIKVYNYLASKYGELVSEERTAKLEELMYMIEKGEADYQAILEELYYEMKHLPRVIALRTRGYSKGRSTTHSK
ncbi:MAG: reverse gyrase [Thermoprotei archaeon]|nr:MAG: reverse gyrase [Thermoprotei archaeon]